MRRTFSHRHDTSIVRAIAPAVGFIVFIIASTYPLAHASETLRFDAVKLGKGAIESEITGVVQDRRGFMWFGTRFGLIRFDGRETKVLRHDPETAHSLSADAIEFLAIDALGYLWLGLDNGRIDRIDPVSLRAAHFSLPSTANGGPPTAITALVAFHEGILVIDGDGRLFATTAAGASLEPFTPPADLQRDGPPVSLFVDPAGFVWVGMTAGSMRCLDAVSGRAVNPGLRPDDLARVDVWLLRDREGTLWGQARGGGLIRCPRGESATIVDIPGGDRDQPLLIEAIVEDGENIFIGSAGQGLIHFDRASAMFQRFRTDAVDPHSIRSDLIHSLCRDRSGALWIGTDEGISRYSRHKNKFGYLRVPHRGRPGRAASVSALEADTDGRLWIGTFEAGLTLRIGDEVRPLQLRDGGRPLGNTVHALRMRDQSRLLVAVDEGLFELDVNTLAIQRLTAPQQITDILIDHAGELWISGYVVGVARVDRQARAARPFVLDSNRDTLDATCLFEDRDGTLWIGTDGDGLYRLGPRRDAYYHYTRTAAASSLSDDRVICIAGDAAGAVWIGTRYGLNRFNPENSSFQRYFEADALPDNIICALAPGAGGDLWISTPSGIGRFDPRSRTGVIYDSSDGLQDERFSPLAVTTSADGIIHFGGVNGISTIDPAHLDINRTPPPVVITSFRVAGVESLNQTTPAEPVYRIPWEQNFFTIDFAVLDFTEPARNQTAFQLEGYDENVRMEKDAGSVSYSRVPPGDYRFFVRGANNDGIWNESGAILRITVVPPFWMTIEFQVLVVILAAAAVFSVYKIRTSAIKRQRNLLQREVDERRIAQARLEANQDRLRSLAVKLTIAEEQERRRIAQLLHDQIGQSLMMSMVRLDKLVSAMQERKQVEEVNRVIKIIDSVIVETRSLTVELSPPSLYKFGLEAAIESLVDKFRKDHGINTVVLRGADSKLSKEANVLLFQAARELLVNVFKHAHASRVQVKLDNDGRRCFMSIEDDGVGFEPVSVLNDSGDTKGFGLFSFQEQIENIGGALMIESAPGKGTRVTISIPLRDAAGVNT